MEKVRHNVTQKNIGFVCFFIGNNTKIKREIKVDYALKRGANCVRDRAGISPDDRRAIRRKPDPKRSGGARP
jgi:hypothetical protein